MVSEVKVEQLRGSSRAGAVEAVSKREHTMLDGEVRTGSRSTLYRWLGTLRSATASRASSPKPDRPSPRQRCWASA